MLRAKEAMDAINYNTISLIAANPKAEMPEGAVQTMISLIKDALPGDEYNQAALIWKLTEPRT